MAITYRAEKGSPLTSAEFDDNFQGIDFWKLTHAPLEIEITGAEGLSLDFLASSYFAVTLTTTQDVYIYPPLPIAIPNRFLIKFIAGSTSGVFIWDPKFRPISVTLPTVKNAVDPIYVAMVYNQPHSKFDVLAVSGVE
jgi:hypothetical protein